MARGSALTAHQIKEALTFNRARHSRWIPQLREALRLAPSPSAIDEGFVRAVADWQESSLGGGQGNGKVDSKTEAHLNIQHPKASRAVEHARNTLNAGSVLFDSWGNDVRDNNNDGVVDGRSEVASDGSHFGRVYHSFRVMRGSYSGLGWNNDKTLNVLRDQTITGAFRYKVCADIVSGAYHDVGAMPMSRSTASILQSMRTKGYVWHASDGYPSEWLPGDFICTLGHGGGHSGIVTRRAPINQTPVVVELPGPSTKVDLGEYDPASRNDIREGQWTKAALSPSVHYIGRLLLSKLSP